ncbi:DsbA family protein [Weissella koreensis]|uniref:DsbA family oxidoreductase n=1 Tax=Weissella koreensis TaxID=165096 RepID=A0A7H1MLU5_9LACO|nr:DsbA family oxidoreductase [Weissella koreensis]AVH75227.1 DsbA family oxidoreductase [Weissella koreensis]QGN20452.1 thioredoxin domain-containing protein [Weissella koreensis]QNT64431.1 DsbA family oxidoreductase [Weissella koreensis]
MEIKYWSDIACPFCYIGSNRMKRAMKEIGIYDKTQLEFKSFELDPTSPKETNEGYINHFTHGNRDLEPQARAQMEQIESMAHGDGLSMDINSVVPTNTVDAHRIIKLAESKHDPELTERVISSFYKTYFSDGLSIADHKILFDASITAGLDEKDILDVLNSDKYHKDVIADEIEAQQSGIHAAPFFVINNKYGISGAQPYDVFVKALKQVQLEENSL